MPLAVPRPPRTARECLQTFMGAEHVDHSVAEYNTLNSCSVITCSCGAFIIVDATAAQKAGIAPSEVRHSLRNAPQARR